MSVRRVSSRTSTNSESTSVQTVTTRVIEATSCKCVRRSQESNDNTTSITPKGRASNNFEPLTSGDTPSLVRKIVNTLAEGTGAPSLNGGATSGNEGSILRCQGGSSSAVQSAEGLDCTSRSGKTGGPRQHTEAGMLPLLVKNSDIYTVCLVVLVIDT